MLKKKKNLKDRANPIITSSHLVQEGSSAVKNPLANEEDVSLIPHLGRSRMLWRK